MVLGAWWGWGEHSKEDSILQAVPKSEDINIPGVPAAGKGALSPAGQQGLLLGRGKAGQGGDCHSGDGQTPLGGCFRKPAAPIPTTQPHSCVRPEPCLPQGLQRAGGC